MRLTYDRLLTDPDLLARTLADARRARSQAIYRFIKSLFG
jgi:hypothetical protein